MRIPLEFLAAGLCLTACGPGAPSMSATEGESSSEGSVSSSAPTGGMSSASDPGCSGDPSRTTSSDTSRDSSGQPFSTDGYYEPCECYLGETRECDGGTGAQVCIEGDGCSHWSDCYLCEEGEPWPCNYVPCGGCCPDGQECSEWGFCEPATSIPMCDRQALSLSEIELHDWVMDMELADVDGDGLLDLVALIDGPAEIEVALGDGAGAFFAGTVYPTSVGTRNWSMVIADFNGDGWPDVAATSDSPTPNLSVLLGQAGVFGAPVVSKLPFETWRTFAGDFDADGNPDLLTYNLNLDAELALFRGDGNGGFLTPVAHDDPNNGTFGITVGAIAGGPPLDVVIMNPKSPNVSVLEYSQGPGFTTVATLTGVGTTPYFYVFAGDIDGDSVGDVIAFRNTVGSDQLQTWPQLMPGAQLNVDWIFPELTADVDGDGRHELVANVWGSDQLKVIYFDTPCIQTYQLPSGVSDLAAGDIDGDGEADIIASFGPKVWILRSAP